MRREHEWDTAMPVVIHLTTLLEEQTLGSGNLRDTSFLPSFIQQYLLSHQARHWGCHMQEDSPFSWGENR